ncbi:MAG: hybrid sensor histidine kinase/response regulator [Oceanospirillaceae bacterium]
MLHQKKLKTILVIDDEEIVRHSFCDFLEDLGYQVIGAANGKTGLVLALASKPDLILTDLRMPLMGGIEFIEKCTVALPDTPVIVISGAGLMGDVVNALHLGAFDYLTKPIRDPDLLQAAVSRALEQVRLRQENTIYQQHLEELVEQRTIELSVINTELELHQQDLEKLVSRRTKELQVVINNLKDTQQQLIDSAKMASLGRLVAGVSHELNTPLGICLTFISSLGQKINDFEKDFVKGVLRREDFENFLSSAQESSAIVINNLTQASELVQNFKMVSVDVSSDMRRKFDIVAYFNNVINSLKPELFDTQVTIHSAPEYRYIIDSYPGLFSQILTNLVMNSMTHGFTGGFKGHIKIELYYEGNLLVISYKDNGCGVSEEVKAQMYEPFFTTARGTGGSGLGLNILYNLVVNNLSGTVRCYSELNEGVEFLIKLPMSSKTE